MDVVLLVAKGKCISDEAKDLDDDGITYEVDGCTIGVETEGEDDKDEDGDDEVVVSLLVGVTAAAAAAAS